MHYYKKNIGDYAKKTGRLTLLQHGAYTILFDACYDREKFPTLEEAIEWSWAITQDEIDAVEFVLKRFFTFQDGVYVQSRIQEEIVEYHSKANKNKEIALEREAKRRGQSTNRAQVVNETPPNHKPITTNHKPITNKITAPIGFSEFWDAYDKKVGKPNSLKAWAKIDFDKYTLVQIIKAAKADKQAKPDNKYRKDPERWLKGQHWLDELVVEQVTKPKELPLVTEKQIEDAYRIECGGDPSKARFNSYFEMKKYVLDQREKRTRSSGQVPGAPTDYLSKIMGNQSVS